MELPVGWRRLDAEGCQYLAYYGGSNAAAGCGPAAGTDSEILQLAGDALPVTVRGLDILSPPTDIQAAGLPRGAVPASSIIALEYQPHDVLDGFGGLYVVDAVNRDICGRPARRMDLTHRGSGMALFTRRWVMDQGRRTLEIAATCPLDHFRHHIQDFDALEDRIHVVA